ALLRGLREAGVGAIELRALRPDTPRAVTAACASAVLEAGLCLTIHATLAELSAKAFFAALSPALELLPADHPAVPITVHSARTGSETLDRAATVRLLRLWADDAAQRGRNVVLALENNRIHTSGLSIMDCDGVISTVREVNRPNVGTCFDFGHLYSNFLVYPECTPFLPPEDFLRAAVQTHIHGVTGITHYPLLEDNLPLEDYLRHLKAAGYRGIYNLELESGRFWRDIEPREGFELSVKRLKECLAKLEGEEA
ncbi:MAG: sugar phosphate isomerase/epimerase, partial [Clostridia bacterium]|nr:sugar phosphate isomerase/epimerase [Clostridia bacterium]